MSNHRPTTLLFTSNAAKMAILLNYMRVRIGLSVVAGALIASISAAETPPFITGKVTAINDDGTVLLENSRHFYLWGLKLTNYTDVRNLLIGRRVFCRTVAKLDPVISADCELMPRDDNTANLRDNLDLLVWLVDFKLATAECSDLDLNISGNALTGQVRYRCSDQRRPQRSEAEELYPELPY